MRKITDPALLQQLETQGGTEPGPSVGRKKVTDPNLLSQLEGQSPQPETPIGDQVLSFLNENVARQGARAVRTGTTGLVGGISDLAQTLTRPIGIYGSQAIRSLGDVFPGADFDKMADTVYSPWAQSASDVVRGGIDKATNNYAAPRNALERIQDTGGEFVSGLGVGGLAKGAGIASEAAVSKAPSLINAFVEANSPRTISDLTSNAAAGAASQTAAEAGGGPVMQFLASMFGGAAGGAAGGTTRAVTSPRETAKVVTQPVIEGATNLFLNAGEGGVKNAMESDFAKRGQELENLTGINLDLAELTGNQRAITAKDYANTSIASADTMFQKMKEKVQKAEDYLNNSLNKIDANPSGDLTTGQSTMKAHQQAITGVRNARREMANAEFGMADKLNGGNPSITPNNFVNTLKEFIDKSKSTLATDAQKKAGAEAEKYLNRLTMTEEVPQYAPSTGYETGPAKVVGMTKNTKTRPVTAKDIQHALEDFGDAAAGSGNIWADISTAGDRRFATVAKEALMKDLEEAAQSGNMAGESAKQLLTARQHYKEASDELDRIQNTVLGRYLAEPDARSPERVMEQVKNMRPSELNQTLDLLDKTDTAAASNVRRYMLERALNKAKTGKGAVGEGLQENLPYSPASFLRELPDEETRKIIFKNDPKALNEVNAIIETMNRIAYMGGREGKSPTFPRQQVEQMAQDSTSIRGMGRNIMRVLAPRELATILTDPDLRGKFQEGVNRVDTPFGDRLLSEVFRKVARPATTSVVRQKPQEDPEETK